MLAIVALFCQTQLLEFRIGRFTRSFVERVSTANQRGLNIRCRYPHNGERRASFSLKNGKQEIHECDTVAIDKETQNVEIRLWNKDEEQTGSNEQI